jgi:hypothetical protein
MRSRRGTVALAFLALTLALSSGGPVRAQAPASIRSGSASTAAATAAS